MQKNVHTLNVRMKRIKGCPVRHAWVRQIILAVLETEKVSTPLEVDCLITNDAGIQHLNMRYRGIDAPTDVLSFALDEPGVDGSVFPRTPGAGNVMGIIVVSYPTALAQAGRNGVPVQDEMRLLLVHGVLHLLGYDHSGKSGGAVMRGREKQILDLLSEKKAKS
jgi:probable rRNA maturation factor